MPIGSMLLVVIALGIFVYAVHRWGPLTDQWKALVNFVAIFGAAVYLLKASGLLAWIRGLVV